MKARLAIHALNISLGLASCNDRQHVSSFDGRPIETVGFHFVGEKGVNEKQLSRVIRSAPGSRYSADVINNDIRALFESGLADDVRVLAEPVEGKVSLVFEIRTRPGSGPPMFFIGNTAFSDVRLARELDDIGDPGAKGDVTDRLNANAARIEEFYRSNGYPETSVRVRTFGGGSATEDDFHFIIDEGRQQPRE